MARNMIGCSESQVAAIVENEMENLEYLAMLNPALTKCELPSVRMAFKRTIMQGLSFDPDAGLVYTTTRNVKVKNVDGTEKTILVMEAKPTVNGMVSICMRAGSLKEVVKCKANFDEKGYVKDVVVILRPVDASDIAVVVTLADFKKRELASHNQNTGTKGGNFQTLNNANKLYSSYYPENPGQAHTYEKKGGIDPAFAETKALKIAIKKARLDMNVNGPKRVSTEIPYVKVVDEKLDEQEDFDYSEEIPSSGNPIPRQEEHKQEPPKVKPKDEERDLDLWEAIAKLTASADCLPFYKEHQDKFDMNFALKDKFRKITVELKEKEKPQASAPAPKPAAPAPAPKPAPAAHKKTEITSDDL